MQKAKSNLFQLTKIAEDKSSFGHSKYYNQAALLARFFLIHIEQSGRNTRSETLLKSYKRFKQAGT